jgi:hypothetical protein
MHNICDNKNLLSIIMKFSSNFKAINILPSFVDVLCWCRLVLNTPSRNDNPTCLQIIKVHFQIPWSLFFPTIFFNLNSNTTRKSDDGIEITKTFLSCLFIGDLHNLQSTLSKFSKNLALLFF